MSIYKENINITQLARNGLRVLSNGYYMFRSGNKAGKPFGIKFEVSAVCNLRCIMCPLSKGLKRKQGVLGFEKFKKIYDEITPPYLNLTGIGEPLLNKDLFKIINYAKNKRTIVKLDTNATLLDKKSSEELLSTNPNIISVSIDGVNKESYEKIRKGAKFENVIENLKNLIKKRNDIHSKTKVHINFVLQKENIDELINFIKFLDSLKVDSINGDIALPLGSNKNIDNRKIDIKVLASLRKDLQKIKTNASLNIEHITEFIECNGDILKKAKARCYYPWYYPSITWDGNLVPCCYICDNEIVFGNVFDEGFMKVWNNEKIKNFRKMIATKKTGICKNCFIDESYIADKLKIIHRIPLLNRLSNRKLI